MTDAPGTTLPGLLDGLADIYGDRPAIYGDRPALPDDNLVLSYRELAARAEGIARRGGAQEFAAGDVVCLIMS